MKIDNDMVDRIASLAYLRFEDDEKEQIRADLENLTKKPEVVLFHRGIDQEGEANHPWNKIKLIKAKFPESKTAVAGGLNLETSARALNNGADIIIIGRAITQADNIEATINDFLHLL